MNIKNKLKSSIWKTPFFFMKSILVFIKLTRAGALILILNIEIIPKKLKFILKILNIFIYKNHNEEIGSKLFKCLVKLGPGYIKFGQALSTRSDLLGMEVTKHLKNLQDNVKPFSSLIAKEIIENETKLLINDIFISFNETPIAAASVAQVHSGILINGEKVAIKILRPKIELILFRDFKFFYWTSKCIEFLIPKTKRLKLSQTVEVFSNISLNEIDLTMEASAADELAENFKNHLNFRVPKIFWNLTSKKILVLEYIEGIKIDDLPALKKYNLDINKITNISAEVFFLQVFRDGFFHGDMHPGNIFIDKKGMLIPIDFGIMGRLNSKDRQFLALLLTYLLDKNFKKVVEIHSEANMLGSDVSHEQLALAIRAISTPILNKPIGDISLAKLLGQILGLSKLYNIEIQSQFSLLQKTMLMAEGTARQLSPETNMWELSRPLIKKWIDETNDPFNILEEWFHKNKLILLKLPEIILKIEKLISKK
ncbi:MAG: AarF/UbiB family protein [Proteobacteria bacterium]|nr:AarF/UbiB family protein [Pseudomonadota bacterium]